MSKKKTNVENTNISPKDRADRLKAYMDGYANLVKKNSGKEAK